MTWLALWPVERVSSWSSELELESGIVDFIRIFNAESQRRRAAEYAEFCSRVEQMETFVQGSHPEPSITYSASSIEWSASFFLFCL